MEPSPTSLPRLTSYLQTPTADQTIEVAISALTRHFETQLHKRKQLSSECGTDMYSHPQTNRFDLAQPSLLFCNDRFSFLSRSSSQGDDTVGRESPIIFADTPRRERTSRYLSEGARKEIIARIDCGEKQVALAKEFNVSRAAICNLYKNRWEVLTRGVRDLTATHPKKSRKKAILQKATPVTSTTAQVSAVATSATSIGTCPISIEASRSIAGLVHHPTPALVRQNEPQQQEHPRWSGARMQVPPQDHIQVGHRNLLQDAVGPRPRDRGTRDILTASSTVAAKQFLVHEASAYSYPCRNLVATLRNECISTAIFQQRAMRLTRLLIEEVFTCLPHDDEELTNTYGDVRHTMKALDAADFCAVTMEDKGMVLLRAFSDISPDSPTGVVSLSKKATESSVTCSRIYSKLPTIHPGQFVLLLDIECAVGEKACSVLHHLVHDKQVPAKNIYYVTVISAFEGLQNVFRHFPDVSLITAQVDTVLDDQQRIRPGIGDFVQRYWNVKTVV